MIKFKLIGFSLLSFFFQSCLSDDMDTIKGDFEFITSHSASVMVGGIVGIKEHTFEKGEIYTGVRKGGKEVEIRIAPHSKLNDDCPNSWCYQEFLNVPREYLRIVN